MIAWEMLKAMAPRQAVKAANEAELLMRFDNRSVIELKGADSPDSLRGVGLNGVVFDEYSQQPSNIYTEIIRPAISDKRGWVIWIGTPKGRNEFYRLYKEAIDKNDWERWLLKASETHILAAEELALARQDMDENEFNQEYECSFENIVRGAVYGDAWGKLIERGGIKRIEYDPTLATYTSWDFGIGDATAIGVYQVLPLGTEVRLINCYENTDKPLEHYIQWVKGLGIEKFTGHYGDPSGKSRNLLTGRSVFEELHRNKLYITARKSDVIDKIEATRKLITNQLVVDERCSKLIDAITSYHYTWNEDRGQYTREPFHDWSSHQCDQLGYFAVNYLTPAKLMSHVEKMLVELKERETGLNLDMYKI